MKHSKLCTHPGRFHLGSDGLTVMLPHPQSITCFAREQGYVVARVEAWCKDLAPAIVTAMNADDACRPGLQGRTAVTTITVPKEP